MSIILASASPRRRELLSLITEDFIVLTSEVDETLPESISPKEAVMLLAEKKARAVAEQNPESVVIGSDTVVAVDGEILGKPVDNADAASMLKKLSGRWHEVFTGVCVIKNNKATVFYDGAAVKFADMSNREIDEYIKSGECNDKAGAYGIQGFGARYIEGINGDYYSVMGLPVRKLYKTLNDLAISSPDNLG